MRVSPSGCHLYLSYCMLAPSAVVSAPLSSLSPCPCVHVSMCLRVGVAFLSRLFLESRRFWPSERWCAWWSCDAVSLTERVVGAYGCQWWTEARSCFIRCPLCLGHLPIGGAGSPDRCWHLQAQHFQNLFPPTILFIMILTVICQCCLGNPCPLPAHCTLMQ